MGMKKDSFLSSACCESDISFESLNVFNIPIFKSFESVLNSVIGLSRISLGLKVLFIFKMRFQNSVSKSLSLSISMFWSAAIEFSFQLHESLLLKPHKMKYSIKWGHEKTWDLCILLKNVLCIFLQDNFPEEI